MADLTPYSTAKPYFGGLNTWLTKEDQERIAAYQLYEEMYWSASDTGIESEGSEPILLPVAKSIIEAVHRFLAVGWTYNVVGDSDEANDAFLKLFKREQIQSKVSSQKRFGLIRGDAMLHIVADPNKTAGSRISVYELDPASYFPIYDIDDPDKLVGVHLIEQIADAEGKMIIRRQTYRKQLDEETGEPTGVITSELAIFETVGWDDRFGRKPEEIKLIRILEPETPLPEQIKSIPIYHWRNMRNPGDFFGVSLLRGIERLLKAIDQTVTDQDLSIALTSLGVYVTDSKPPVNDEGEETGWIIGPARVVEIAQGRQFSRVSGITSITPSVEHATLLEDKARSGASVPAVAIGDVDVQTAESGIALAMKLMPLLAANAERELEMISVLDHFLYDLQTMWFPAYEDITFPETTMVVSSVADPMPVNRSAVISEVVSLISQNLITTAQAIEKLSTLGWQYSEDDIKALVAAAEARANAIADPFGDRVNRDMNGDTGGAK